MYEYVIFVEVVYIIYNIIICNYNKFRIMKYKWSIYMYLDNYNVF